MTPLETIRHGMKQQNLDALLIPMSDRFQSEYVPAHDRILQWLTGFTGSAGFAVVLADKAAFFTDGRYTIQAAQEVNTAFERLDSGETRPQEWLSQQLKQGMHIGFHPWHFSISQLQAFEKTAAIYDAQLVATPLADDAWQENRPAAPTLPAFLHPIEYAGESTAAKLQKLRNEMAKTHTDAIFIALPESVNWLFNLRGQDLPHTPFLNAYALIEHHQTSIFTRMDKIPDALHNERHNIAVFKPLEDLEKHLTAMQQKLVMLDPDSCPFAVGAMLASAVHAPDPCLLPKACKNNAEVAGMKHAHVQDGAAMVRFLHWLNGAMQQHHAVTEATVDEKLREFRRQQPEFFSESFPTIAGFNGNGAIVHYRATEHTAAKIMHGNGHLLLIDSGGQYHSGTTDITRTVALGTPTTAQKTRFTQVLEGHIALASAHFPKGTTGAQLDVLARQFLWADGVDYAHGTGHGVGAFLNVHEGPCGISKRASNTALQPGMILSNEPGYYEKDAYGIRIESLILVVEKDKPGYYGFETITLCPLDAKLVDFGMLSGAEKAWLQHYHAQVKAAITPLVDAEEAAWLAQACAAFGA